MCAPSLAPGESGGTPTGGGVSGTNIGGIGIGLQALGVFNATQGTYRQSQATKVSYDTQAAVERNKATVDEWRASDAVARGEQASFTQGLKAGQLEGAQRARFASAGVSLDEGSPLNVLLDSEYMHGQDMKTISDNSAKEAWVLRESAKNERTNADLLSYRAGQENPTRAAAGTLLTGAGAVASSWYKMRRGSVSDDA